MCSSSMINSVINWVSGANSTLKIVTSLTQQLKLLIARKFINKIMLQTFY